MLAELQALSRDDVAAYFRAKLCPSGPQRRKLCIKITAQAHLKNGKNTKPAQQDPAQQSGRAVEITDVKMTQRMLPRLQGYFSPCPTAAAVDETESLRA